MPQYWISFRSLTHAQRASRVLERKGVTAMLTRLPQGLSLKGCGYAIILRHRTEEGIRMIREAQIPFGAIFVKNELGTFREVKL